MTYLLLKHLHVACVVLSISGFVVRGVWMMRESPWLQKKWVRVTPHVIDTILLGSAILLTMQIQQYPFVRHRRHRAQIRKHQKNPRYRLARGGHDIPLHRPGRAYPSGSAFRRLTILVAAIIRR
jgi:hypothetical protein